MIYSIQRYCIHDGAGIRTVIFFKGCQLICPWCANPESQSFHREIGYFEDKCISCGACRDACPTGAVRNGHIDRTLCASCGKCTEACPQEALQLFGREISVKELVAEALKDIKFYRKSGGGVTLSGGEAVLQPQVLFGFLEEMKKRQIHTALESNACFSPALCRRLLPYIDQFLLDLKHMDSEKHKQVLGVSNKNVLKNLKIAAEKELTIRIPLIPGFNDDDANLSACAAFAKELRCPIDLLGFHNLGAGKYHALSRTYPYSGHPPYTPETLEEKKELLRRLGAKVLP